MYNKIIIIDSLFQSKNEELLFDYIFKNKKHEVNLEKNYNENNHLDNDIEIDFSYIKFFSKNYSMNIRSILINFFPIIYKAFKLIKKI